MDDYLRRNLLAWTVYTLISMPFLSLAFGWSGFWVSYIVGFLFGMLNEIIAQLRILNKQVRDSSETPHIDTYRD